MNASDLLDLIGNADDSMIAAAKDYKSPKKNARIKWFAVAACLCLVLAAIPMAFTILQHQGSTDDLVAEIAPFEFNGACYQVIDNPEILEKYGLPRTITAECAGEHISYLEREGTEYQISPDKTDIELYTYAPMPCSGVYVVREGNTYCAALFCNHILEGSAGIAFSEIYRTYGVEKAADIVSICEYTGTFGHEKETNVITTQDTLDEFYNASLALDCYGNDAFQATEIEVFPTEGQRVTRYEELASDSTKLRIETASGLVFFITAYPTYGWLEGDLSYFKFNPAMTEWFSENIR